MHKPKPPYLADTAINNTLPGTLLYLLYSTLGYCLCSPCFSLIVPLGKEGRPVTTGINSSITINHIAGIAGLSRGPHKHTSSGPEADTVVGREGKRRGRKERELEARRGNWRQRH